MLDLAERLRSRAREDRHHRKYRAVAADEIEQLRRERDEARWRAASWERVARNNETIAEAKVAALRAEIRHAIKYLDFADALVREHIKPWPSPLLDVWRCINGARAVLAQQQKVAR
jgi:hypothetical protein